MAKKTSVINVDRFASLVDEEAVKKLVGESVFQLWDEELVEWAKKNMMSFNPPLVSAKDSDIPICVNSAEEAIEVLKVHQAVWKKKIG